MKSMSINNGTHVLILLGLLHILPSCSQVPITGRKRLKFVPDSVVNSMSLQEYREFISQHKLSSNTEQTEMVKRVGQRIRQAVEEYSAQEGMSLEGYSWEFNLIEDPSANAWAMPGGKVVVYTGLLAAARDEASLAVVIGHEISHVIAKHGSERMTHNLIIQTGGMALSHLLAKEPAQAREMFMKSYGIGTKVGVLLPFSRTHEAEADHLGLIFMAMAGYDPHTAVDFWQRMATQGKGMRTPEFLNTHPSDEKRIKHIKELIPGVMQYYERQRGQP